MPPQDTRFSVQGCSLGGSRITSPFPGQQISGNFTVLGSASIANFNSYKLEVRPDFTNIYNFYSGSYSPVESGALGQINASLFDPGLYWLRLVVVENSGNFVEPCAIPVIFVGQ